MENRLPVGVPVGGGRVTLWNRVLWALYAYVVIPDLSSRAATYRAGRLRGVDSAQMSEAWKLLQPFSLRERVGFTDSITPGSAANAMRMLRAVRDPSYFVHTVIDARYVTADNADNGMRAQSRIFGGAVIAPSIGYQDVIDLAEAGVPAEYARQLLPFMRIAEVLACYRSGAPVDYALRASHARHSPSEMWAAGVPTEYLV